MTTSQSSSKVTSTKNHIINFKSKKTDDQNPEPVDVLDVVLRLGRLFRGDRLFEYLALIELLGMSLSHSSQR